MRGMSTGPMFENAADAMQQMGFFWIASLPYADELWSGIGVAHVIVGLICAMSALFVVCVEMNRFYEVGKRRVASKSDKDEFFIGVLLFSIFTVTAFAGLWVVAPVGVVAAAYGVAKIVPATIGRIAAGAWLLIKAPY